MANQYSIQLSQGEAAALKRKLECNQAFKAASREYADYCFEAAEVNVAFYPKKGRLLIQGRGSDDFLTNILQLQPEAEAPALSSTLPALVDTTPHFGVDESGKGDYFGPLVIAGVYTDERCAAELVRLGCKDSKAIPDDKKIGAIAEKIKKTAGVV